MEEQQRAGHASAPVGDAGGPRAVESTPTALLADPVLNTLIDYTPPAD